MDDHRLLRCEVAGSDAPTVTSIARSLVHHVCTLADVEVATAETLEIATAELLDEITVASPVDEIRVDPDFDGIDLVVRTRDAVRTESPFRPGPVVEAAFDSIEVRCCGEIHVRHRFESSAR